MKYTVSVGGRTLGVDVRDGRGVQTVTVDGAPYEVEAVAVPGGLLLRVANLTYDVALASASGLGTAIIRGSAHAFEIARAGTPTARSLHSGHESVHELRSPMPGRVVRVLVKAGVAVAAGEALVVIEAMKMENELRATHPGVVTGVEVREGENIEAQALLLRLGPA